MSQIQQETYVRCRRRRRCGWNDGGWCRPENGYRTLLLEKNLRLGRKLIITGKGRCNIVNNCDVPTVIASIPSNGRFLYGAVSKFPPQDIIDFFEGLGLPVKTERGNRVFPQSDTSRDVVDTMVKFVRENGVEIVTGTAKHLLFEEEAGASLG